MSFFSDFKDSDAFPGYLLCKRKDYQNVEKEEAVGFHYQRILNFSLERSSLEICHLTLAPNSQRDLVTSHGFEFIYLLSGNVTFHLGDHVLELETGDALLFDGDLPHVPINSGANPASILVQYFISY